jgi:hypothetical protein
VTAYLCRGPGSLGRCVGWNRGSEAGPSLTHVLCSFSHRSLDARTRKDVRALKQPFRKFHEVSHLIVGLIDRNMRKPLEKMSAAHDVLN